MTGPMRTGSNKTAYLGLTAECRDMIVVLRSQNFSCAYSLARRFFRARRSQLGEIDVFDLRQRHDDAGGPALSRGQIGPVQLSSQFAVARDDGVANLDRSRAPEPRSFAGRCAEEQDPQ